MFILVLPTQGGSTLTNKEVKMTQLNISGMTCQHCERAVTSALESVTGVERARVDLARGSAEVEGNAESTALIAAVEEEGYQVTLSER